MRIQLIVAGFNRALSVTHGSLIENVARPISRWGTLVDPTLVLGRSRRRITSARSKENGFSEWSVPSELRHFEVKFVSQEELDDEQSEFKSEILEISQPPTQTDTEMVSNLIRYLGILDTAKSVINQEADYVFFCRPDLLWHRSLTVPGFISFRSGLPVSFQGAATANWGGGAAPNDRFAFLSAECVSDYFGRIGQYKDFLDFLRSGGVFSAESLLGFAMQDHQIYPVIPTRASRVRLGGFVKKERFRRSELPPVPIPSGPNGLRFRYRSIKRLISANL